MIGRFFIEEEHYSAEQIRDAWTVGDSPLGQSSTGLPATEPGAERSPDIIETLRSMSIGRKPLLQEVSGGYRFNYVGVIAAGGFIFPILPKYYTYEVKERIPAAPAAKALVEVLAAIRKYMVDHPNKWDELRFTPVGTDTPIVQNRLGLYRFLLEDFVQYGPYTNTHRIREHNGEGDIDWPRTIDRIMPMLNGGDPAYMELITSRRTKETSNFIARIQLAMLTEISIFIEGTGLNGVLRMPILKQSRETLEDLGDAETLVRSLRRELNMQFETRRKLLLRNMINYFDGRSPAGRTTVTAEGTGSFNLVWEGVCKSIFKDAGSELPKPKWEFLPELSWAMSPSEQQDSEAEMDSAADERHASEEIGEADAQTLIPDVVNNGERRDKSVLYILDAKYYMPTYTRTASGDAGSRGSIAHQPGIGDIIKQYFYMMALQRGLRIGHDSDDRSAGTGISITVKGNAFVLPAQRRLSPDRGSRYLLMQRGRVSLDFMNPSDDDGDSPDTPRYILLYEMDAEQALRMYLDGTDTDASSLQYLQAMFDDQVETMNRRIPCTRTDA